MGGLKIMDTNELPWLIIPCQGCRFAVIRVRAGQQREGMRCKWCEMGVKLAGRKEA